MYMYAGFTILLISPPPNNGQVLILYVHVYSMVGNFHGTHGRMTLYSQNQLSCMYMYSLKFDFSSYIVCLEYTHQYF
jgi:hypothetical protein